MNDFAIPEIEIFRNETSFIVGAKTGEIQNSKQKFNLIISLAEIKMDKLNREIEETFMRLVADKDEGEETSEILVNIFETKFHIVYNR